MDYISLVAAVSSAIAALASAWVAYRTYGATERTFRATRDAFQENRNLVYLQFYELIARHHSQELTKLRREVRTGLKIKAEKAIAENKTLAETDPDFHLQVSTLANYYEALGMFLEGNWDFFPSEVRETMKKMLHNSVVAHWEEIERYKRQIHPNPPRDWAGSFQWLYGVMKDYKRDKTL